MISKLNFSVKKLWLTYLLLSLLLVTISVGGGLFVINYFPELAILIYTDYAFYWLLLLFCLQESILFLSIYFWIDKKNRENLIKSFFSQKIEVSIKTVLVVAVVTTLSIFLLEQLTNFLDIWSETSQENTIDLLKSIWLIPSLILGWIIAPFFEEVIFRGLLTKYFLSKNFTVVTTWVITSFLFAIVHWQILALLPLFLFWLILFWIYYSTKNLFYSFLAHAWNNIFSILVIFWIVSLS